MAVANSAQIITTSSTNVNSSILSLIWSADFVGKSVIFILICASIWTWTIVINKILYYRSLKKKMILFEHTFWSEKTLDNLYQKVSRSINNPLAAVFMAAISECKKDKKIDSDKTGMIQVRKIDRIVSKMTLSRNKEIEKIECNLGFLATIGSSAPFIGLFGTVWGIMHSFQSIAASKNTTLSVVAPGIAEALFATAIGLFVAIPASIFYNYLTGKIINLESRIDDFINELYNVISRAIDEGRI